jgi:hypothetical protein
MAVTLGAAGALATGLAGAAVDLGRGLGTLGHALTVAADLAGRTAVGADHALGGGRRRDRLGGRRRLGGGRRGHRRHVRRHHVGLVGERGRATGEHEVLLEGEGLGVDLGGLQHAVDADGAVLGVHAGDVHRVAVLAGHEDDAVERDLVELELAVGVRGALDRLGVAVVDELPDVELDLVGRRILEVVRIGDFLGPIEVIQVLRVGVDEDLGALDGVAVDVLHHALGDAAVLDLVDDPRIGDQAQRVVRLVAGSHEQPRREHGAEAPPVGPCHSLLLLCDSQGHTPVN